jgi:hypothetical protein
MTRRPFDPVELDDAVASGDHAVSELERYAMTSDSDAPHGLSERIMAAVEREYTPRRGLFGWLPSPSSGGGTGRLLRVGALAATLVLAVAGALYAGQLAGLLRHVGGEPTPTESVSPPATLPESTTPAPSPSIVPSPSGTPESSDDNGGSAEGPTAVPTPHEDGGGDESETPRPSPTASPTATPSQSS